MVDKNVIHWGKLLKEATHTALLSHDRVYNKIERKTALKMIKGKHGWKPCKIPSDKVNIQKIY